MKDRTSIKYQTIHQSLPLVPQICLLLSHQKVSKRTKSVWLLSVIQECKTTCKKSSKDALLFMFFQIIFIQIRFLAPMCFKLMQLNFIFSAILQYSVVIGSSQVPFKWFTLQSWHIWWSLLNEIKKIAETFWVRSTKPLAPFFLIFFQTFVFYAIFSISFVFFYFLLIDTHWLMTPYAVQ